MKRLLKQGFWTLVLVISSCTGRKEIVHNNQPINNSISPDTSISTLIAPYKSQLDNSMNEVIGALKVKLENDRTKPESKLGNFIADLTLDYARIVSKREGLPIPDFCLLNYGGFRTSLAAGEITRRDIFELMPFENKVVIVKLDYFKTKAIFDYLAKRGGQPVSNISMEISDSNAVNVKIGRKFIEERDYYIVTSDYLANGGDDMTFFKNAERTEHNKLRDVIIAHFQDYDGPLGSQLDGRIRYAE